MGYAVSSHKYFGAGPVSGTGLARNLTSLLPSRSSDPVGEMRHKQKSLQMKGRKENCYKRSTNSRGCSEAEETVSSREESEHWFVGGDILAGLSRRF